jgi:hypothetical protein
MCGVASKYINRYAALFNVRLAGWIQSRLRGIKGNSFITIERPKQE